MINVLVFPCGSEIGLEVHNALKYDKHINLVGLSSVSSHGRVVYKNYIEGISFITSDTFMEELNKIIEDNNIDVLIPAYDDVILYLSERRDELKCKLATSNKTTCDIARSKRKTYEVLQGEWYIPETFKVSQITEKDLPLFAKPDIGQGSQGIMRIEKMEDLNLLKGKDDEYIISELLPGQEYTVDCFTNRKGELVVASMRMRKRIKTGISVNSVIVELPAEVKQIADAIMKKLYLTAYGSSGKTRQKRSL